MELRGFVIRPPTVFSGLPEYRSPGLTDTELRSFFTASTEGADGPSGSTVLI